MTTITIPSTSVRPELVEGYEHSKTVIVPAHMHHEYYVDAHQAHTTFVVDDNATLRVTVVINQKESQPVRHTIICHEYSTVRYECILMSGNHTVSLDVQLRGAHAQATITGAYIGLEQEELIITSTQSHYAPHTKSELHIKGALAGSARVQYNGTIYVDELAQQTCASQKNTNLMLSSNAHVASSPTLEVLTNDVQCAHGSAVGQLDELQIFYLQSRGMSYQQARKLLLEGFFAGTAMPVAFIDRVIAVEKVCST